MGVVLAISAALKLALYRLRAAVKAPADPVEAGEEAQCEHGPTAGPIIVGVASWAMNAVLKRAMSRWRVAAAFHIVQQC